MRVSEFIRNNRGWFVAALGGLLTIGFFASDADAQVGRYVSSVFVTNNENNPIPVDDLRDRRDAEESVVVSCGPTMQANGTSGYATCFTVPDGQVFVIENVSARAFVPGEHPPVSFAIAHARVATMAGPVTTALVTHRERGVDGNDVVAANQLMKTYAGPNTFVQCHAQRTSPYPEYTSSTCVISGHFEDL